MNAKKSLRQFRMIGIAEGTSFLVLLLIAMPLKYFLNFPQAVKYVGWVHGALFVTYIYFALHVFTVLKKPFVWLVKAGVAAFLPLGTFLFDRELKKEELSMNL
jgi:integral membrane protein